MQTDNNNSNADTKLNSNYKKRLYPKTACFVVVGLLLSASGDGCAVFETRVDGDIAVAICGFLQL